MVTNDHQQAVALIERGQHDEALTVVSGLLNADHDDALGHFLMGRIHADAGRFGMAHAFFARCVELKPDRHEAWNNLGMCLESMHRNGMARQAFEKALSLAKKPGYLANLGLTWLHDGDPHRALRFTSRALEMDSTCKAAAITSGFAHLQLGAWPEGWKGFAQALGGKFRARIDYGLPEWAGERDAHVIVYGEQGLGDEILYGSCIPDVLATARAVTIDCDERLAKVFAASFPHASVHGTRRSEHKPWLDNQTHAIAIGDLPRLFRPSPVACPGTPYLVADPDLRAMYDALQARHDGGGARRIGIAWSAGTRATAGQRRTFEPELFRPLTEHAALFSLQYERPEPDDVLFFHFHPATGRGADFAQTLAFIDSLDAVIGVDTTACHAAGALGKPVMVLVHDRCNWIHAPYQGDRSSWYQSMRLFRQEPGEAWPATFKRLYASDALAQFIKEIP